jgi:hypothetical protein
MKKTALICFVLLLIDVTSWAQGNIKTIQFKPLEKDNFSSIVPLGTVLKLSFDDLEADQKEYSYKITHMDYDWNKSNLFSSEYIDGFQENIINTYENSFNTLQNYTHYEIQIPNQNTKITKSGNYEIAVLDEDENIVFTRHFTLYQNKTTLGTVVKRGRNSFSNNQQHTVQFTINYNDNEIKNPSQDIDVVVLQNNDWNTAITGIKPQFFKKGQLIYKYTNKVNFWSGNEYLNFDSKQLRASTIKIANTEKKDIYHSYLYTEERRDEKFYTHNPDINGQFVIRNIEGFNPNTEADYSWVYFSLSSKEIQNKEVFVYGAFNDFSTSSQNKMSYNSATGNYEAAILLKQGFYNYTFVTKDTANNIDNHELNGSFYQTENEYTVLVYYKAFGQYYHQVIGIGKGFLNKQ